MNLTGSTIFLRVEVQASGAVSLKRCKKGNKSSSESLEDKFSESFATNPFRDGSFEAFQSAFPLR